MSTVSEVTWRSFYPERTLIKARDTEALFVKYSSQAYGVGIHGPRLFDLYDTSPLYPDSNPDLSVLEEQKRIGKLAVLLHDRAGMGGTDLKNKVSIGSGSEDIIGLHVRGMDGARQIVQDLGSAAAYIAQHPELRERSNVVGVTYSELARFASRIGFREMPISTSPGPNLAASLQLAHKIYCAYNGGRERPFEPRMVYLPTEEFVDRFGSMATSGASLPMPRPEGSKMPLFAQAQAEPQTTPPVLPDVG